MPSPDETNYKIEPLKKSHNRDNFNCGSPTLNRYLQQQATQDKRKYVAAPFVAVDLDRKIIIGYYTLSATSINLLNLPAQFIKKLPKYPLVPAILLGRLAVDIQYQKQGWGDLLLMDALARSFSNEIAATSVVVEAKDERAIRFYQSYDFLQFSDFPNRLFLPMTVISKIFQ